MNCILLQGRRVVKKNFWKQICYCSRRDRVTVRMRTPQLESGLVWKCVRQNALNRLIARYIIIIRYPCLVHDFPCQCQFKYLTISSCPSTILAVP
jgi:hypothetical protein